MIVNIYRKLFHYKESFCHKLRLWHYKLLYSDQIKWGNHVILGDSFFLRIDSEKSILKIGDRFICRTDCKLMLFENAKLNIGDDVFFNHGVSVNAMSSIDIKSRTIVGENVKIYDHNHTYDENGVLSTSFNCAKVTIGENCWIASNVVILKGVTIGNGSVVGAGCVINKDIPERSIVHLEKGNLVIKNI
jgi:acetyltransferase-like isoleucine patch superfamily enzyme